MNWVIFKGINSSTIKGLIISELPPISKPSLRVETIVIDGKDGDITENLGYSSYDKTMEIGLARDYDIDEVINFFNGEGKIIFSNEPNKFYIAKIIDSIDFERLVKFRTAKIKFHVQPYKYLLNEKPVQFDVSTQEYIEIENAGLVKSLPIITLYGEGNIEISINNHAIFNVNIEEDFLTIDSMNQECYKNEVLKNRFMYGEFPELISGINRITWSGSLSKVIIEPNSRWL